MEKEHEPTEARLENESSSAFDMSDITAENIAERITAELEKVVDLDEELLGRYVDFLGTMKTKDTEAMLKQLKNNFGERMLPLLETMAHHEQKSIAELGINGLGKIQSFKSAQILAEIDETHPDKKLRKAARKSLYKLKSAGIEVETSHKPLLAESKHQRYKSLISAIDGTGTQLLILTQEMLAGDLHLLQVVASDKEGITDCVSRRGFSKKMFAKLPETFSRQMGGYGPMLVEADYDYAMSLVLDAEALSEEDTPDEYLASKDLFELNEAQAVENPVYQMLDAENLKNQPYFLRVSAELFQDETFLSWHLPLDELSAYAQELLDQEDSVLELSPQFQQERREEVYQRLITEKFDEEALKQLKRRLEIMAYVFMLRENEEDAKKALTAAVTLEKTASTQLKRHPFLRELILISLEAAEYVIEDGYNPEELERGEYVVARNEEGEIVVEFIEE